jgi:gamma-glutamylputrescine oxidase
VILQNWWYTTLLHTTYPQLPPLTQDIKADVLIIGGGAAGLAAAMALKDSGRKVVLLERNICGGSSTGKSAGFLTPDSELELAQLVRRYGVEGARDLWGCAQHGIDLMVSWVHRHGLDCELHKQDSLFLANDKGGWEGVEEEVAARKEMGWDQRLYPEKELSKVLSAKGYAGGVRYPGTYGINPMRYAQGIKRVLFEAGVEIYESSEVRHIHGHEVKTHCGKVTADQIIFCADKLNPKMTRYAADIYHAQTFLSVSEPLKDAEVARIFPDEPLQCWDSSLVYSYYRLTGDQRLLLGGGSALSTFSRNDSHRSGVINRVIRDFKVRFPFLENLEFIQYWPGRIDTTRDLVPTVVRDPEHPWTHFVLGCVGLPWATFCGDFVAQQLLSDDQSDDLKYYRYFSNDRPFLLPTWMESIFGKQAVFSINNAYAKYVQVDKGKAIAFRKDQF